MPLVLPQLGTVCLNRFCVSCRFGENTFDENNTKSYEFDSIIDCFQIAPALICGNTCIYKPSQFTPVTAVTLAEVFTEAGLPDGVLNIIQVNFIDKLLRGDLLDYPYVVF